MTIKSLAVFCGSKSGNNPLYSEHAQQLGAILAQRGISLIYGGGNKGIMGAVANGVLKANGKVTGIMPTLLSGLEHSHQGLTELIEVSDMHTRKKMLYEKCDAALILPGGYGTMDEFFEMLTWNQLNIHSKKIFILNTAGFYSFLIDFIQKMESENFIYQKVSDQMVVISTPQELIALLH
ncbi:MAG: TIGR00730 family Rossman fold protein [Ginsengibacter sp.]